MIALPMPANALYRPLADILSCARTSAFGRKADQTMFAFGNQLSENNK
jgi:hypothetical protein